MMSSILTWVTTISSIVSFGNWTDAEETVIIPYIACAVILTWVCVIAGVDCWIKKNPTNYKFEYGFSVQLSKNS